jgi:hypothetical protein
VRFGEPLFGEGPGGAFRAGIAGDRGDERALHTIVMLRQVHHGPTRAYTSRRIAQGKSQREIRRCLKRTVARQLYRLLERTASTDGGGLTAPLGKRSPTRVATVGAPGRNVAVPLISQDRGAPRP